MIESFFGFSVLDDLFYGFAVSSGPQCPLLLDSMLYLCSTCQTFFHFKIICSFMHDFVNNLTPPSVSGLFSYSSEKHHHYTRSSAAGNLFLQHLRTEYMKNCFLRLGARIWNSIPFCLRSLPKYKFKRLLHRQLLNILMREDAYANVHTLIEKFRKL